MGYKGILGCRSRRFSGVTPLFSSVSFFMVGSSVCCIYTLVTLITMRYADSLDLKIELHNHNYQVRQFVIISAILGILLGQIVAGRLCYMLSHWLLCICYFGTAVFVRSHYFELHLRIHTLLWLAGAAGLLSGLTQTSAFFCITDSSIPGGYGRLITRFVSFFLGCSVSGLNFCWLYAAKWPMKIPNNTGAILLNQWRIAVVISILCALAGLVSLIAAGLTSYLLMTYECKATVDRVSWIQFSRASRYDISVESIRKQVNMIYIPLLWTSNPLFIVFAISITMNSPVSVRLLFGQYLVYAVVALVPVLIFGTGGGFGFDALAKQIAASGTDSVAHSVRRDVTKTRDAVPSSDYYRGVGRGIKRVLETADSLGTGRGPYFPTRYFKASKGSKPPQWSLLKGEVWAQWQGRDAVYRLCSEALSNMHSTLSDWQCLELNEFYDNFTVIMEQYITYITASGVFMDIPFPVKESIHPMLLFREMIKHQQNVLHLQMRRVGKLYATMLKDIIKDSCCGVLKRYKSVHACCRSLIDSLLRKYGIVVDISSMEECICCYMSQKSDVNQLVRMSVDAVSSRCEGLERSLFQNICFKQPVSDPENHSLYIEQRLVCYLRTHCESTILLLSVLLTVDELLLLQEWLCILCKFVFLIHERVQSSPQCLCKSRYVAPNSRDDKNKKCPWICLDALLNAICLMLVKLHSYKLKLLRRMKKFSISYPQTIAEEAILTQTYAITGVIDTVRSLVIVVLAIMDLLNLDECVKNKVGAHVYAREMGLAGVCKGAYHLVLPSFEYLKGTVDTFLRAEGEAFISPDLTNLVLWYSGLVNTITKLCSDLEVDSKFSYEALMREDKEVTVASRDSGNVAKNMALGTDIFFRSNVSALWEAPWLYERKLATNQKYKENGGSKANAKASTNCGKASENCKNEATASTCCSIPEICNAKETECHIYDSFCNLWGILECNGESGTVLKCTEKVTEELKKCQESLKELCENKAGSAACTGDCCKNDANVARFAKLLKAFVDTARSHTTECTTGGGGGGGGSSCSCKCCTGGKNTLGKEKLPATLLNIMKCIFCCKCCFDTTTNEICCALAKVFCCVYKKLCNVSAQTCNNKNCICPCTCGAKPGVQCSCTCQPSQTCTCTTKTNNCECCNTQPQQGTTQPCANLNCWISWFRCYVICDEKCAANTATTGSAATCHAGCENCTKDCGSKGSAECQCKTGEAGSCKKCHFLNLSTSLFFCSTCNTDCAGKSQSECETVSIACDPKCLCKCNKDKCGCCSEVSITPVSDKELKGCCSHRLGCSLQIITKDLESLRTNACNLKTRIDCLSTQTDATTKDIKKLNDCLCDFYNVLCYANYGIKHMNSTVKKMQCITDDVCAKFPCFEKEVKSIAKRDATMVSVLLMLLARCWEVALGGLLLVQRVILLCGSIALQKLRVKHSNDDMNHVKEEQNRNWRSLLNLKGGATWAHGAMCSVVDIGTIKNGRLTALGVKTEQNKQMTDIIFKPDLDPDVYRFSILSVLKYIWVILSFCVLIRFSIRGLIYSGGKGSVPLLTMLTALSAFHLTMAVKGFGFQSVSPRVSEAVKIGRYINAIMLKGMCLILLISWIGNVCSTYSVMRKSLNHMTERMRMVGIYDTDTANGPKLLLQTISATVKSDLNALVSLCHGKELKHMDMISGLNEMFSLEAPVDSYRSYLTYLGLGEELEVSGYLSEVRKYSFLSLDWVLDSLGFLHLYPTHIRSLNRTTTYQKEIDRDLAVMWTAWTKNTLITDTSMRVCNIGKKALLTLNTEFLTTAEDLKNVEDMTNLISVWNSFYETQCKSLTDLCMSYNVRTPIYTESQKAFLRDGFSRMFIDRWERYYMGCYMFVTQLDKDPSLLTTLDLTEEQRDADALSQAMTWLMENEIEEGLLEEYKYWFSRNSEQDEVESYEKTESGFYYQQVSDGNALREAARMWLSWKNSFCHVAGESTQECRKAVEYVFSKVEQFLKEKETYADNLVEAFHKFAMQDCRDFSLEDIEIERVRHLRVSDLLADNGELSMQKISLLSSMQRYRMSPTDVGISIKYRHSIKELLEKDEEEVGLMQLLYWLGTWSIFNSMPIAERDLSHLLM